MSRQRSHDYSKPYLDEYLGTLTTPVLTQRASPDGGGVVVSGACPRCHGRTETEHRRGVPGTGSKGIFDRLVGQRGTPPEPEPEPLVGEVHFCECGHPHPQLPPDPGFVGCGASWRFQP
ncbi:hypothetical protein ACFZB9_15935 [Kitasatospora sp. NPDC008050]|uniref:hypothetical protein n=1 Tax=Kitasatospora sp. NPDC008050 TaxID=3364021 RepID=UPI0036F01320